MASKSSLFVCDTPAQAAQAKGFLLAQGFTESQIDADQLTAFSYDAETHSNGAAEIHANKWIVTGRK
jgi:rhodanese-related sulfurtransferase